MQPNHSLARRASGHVAKRTPQSLALRAAGHVAKQQPQSLASRAVKQQPHSLSQLPRTGSITVDGRQYQVIVQQDELAKHQQDDSVYRTLKSQGIPNQVIKLPQMPSVFTLAMTAIVAMSFLVAASMFSIGLTAYSNSVDRIDSNRSFLEVN